MALTKCRECGADVSSQAKACARCGAPVPVPPSSRWWLWLPVGVVAFLFVVAPALMSVIKALGWETPQYVHDANAAFVACKTMVESRTFRNRTMKDCDELHAQMLTEGERAAKAQRGK